MNTLNTVLVLNWIAITVGLGAVAIATYTVVDPMKKARSWPTGREWKQNPEQARREQFQHTYLFAAIIILVGLVFIWVGVTGL